MTLSNFIKLVLLAAIWGGSFLFMRIAAPVLGGIWMAELRVATAAIFLCLVGYGFKKTLAIRQHWQHYFVLGLTNLAIPFVLYGYAAHVLTASVLAVLNATAPIWSALITAVYTRSMLSAKVSLGMVLGVAGVALLVGFDAVILQPNALLAVLAGLGSAFLYGVASVYAKHAKKVDSFATSQGSLWAATIMIAPLLFFEPMASEFQLNAFLAVLALGVLCSGIAFLIYFRLIQDIGAAPALTVAFLIPVFGVFWGWLFLDEAVGWYTVAGVLTVIVGTALVTGFSPKLLLQNRRKTAQEVA